MPDFGIVDAHVHLADPTRFSYAWTKSAPTLNRVVLPEHLTKAAAPVKVEQIVFVEVDVDYPQHVDEARWIQSLSKSDPRIKGMVAALPLERGRAGHYAGIELFPAAADAAGEVLSEVLCGDIETIELPWQPAAFDALILSEVLEHLVEPWAVLDKLARVVRPGGLVLASSPNVAHWRVVRELVLGRFELADQGVFDRTHMRWFTPESYAAMFERAGFAVVEVAPVTPFSERTRIVSSLTGGRFDHLFMTQISIEAVRR